MAKQLCTFGNGSTGHPQVPSTNASTDRLDELVGGIKRHKTGSKIGIVDHPVSHSA
jgi:hypothetical protein